ncbi:MAG: hypothetical protein V4725_03795 [Bacteroidota bacterium]
MKKFKATLFLIVAMFYGTMLLAQEPGGNVDPKPPRWHSDKGYWVIESNVKTPHQSIVRFFNADRQLIYTENINGVKLDCSKRKTLMKLKRVLEKVVDSYNAGELQKSGTEITTLFNSRKIRI